MKKTTLVVASFAVMALTVAGTPAIVSAKKPVRPPVVSQPTLPPINVNSIGYVIYIPANGECSEDVVSVTARLTKGFPNSKYVLTIKNVMTTFSTDALGEAVVVVDVPVAYGAEYVTAQLTTGLVSRFDGIDLYCTAPQLPV